MDEYVEPWRRQSVSLGGTAPAPNNAHLTQLQPRRDRRNPRLDERIAEARRKAAQHRVSGHSLIR